MQVYSNLPHVPAPTCRSEEVREKFERYGEIRDIYLPKDYYTK
jgi:RNA recognition motif-containing protein